MPCNNNIILASAGSGKTTSLVKAATDDSANKAAIITYTLNGRDELTRKAYEQLGYIAPHLTISTWYSFVLSHFVRPYQNFLYEPRVKAITFDSIPLRLRKIPRRNPSTYYFSSKGRIWRDRVTEFSCQLLEKADNLPIRRIEKIFQSIYIDEAQDLSGWDLELIERLLESDVQIHLVGDPRQATFSTNNNRKNSAYIGEKIVKKFEEWNKAQLVNIHTDARSYRCNQAICDFADLFFPHFPKTISLNQTETGHDGLFCVRQSDVESYMRLYSPQPLRYNKKRDVQIGTPINYGDAKGLTFDRTLIYPHKPLEKYLATMKLSDAGKELAKIYVAVTRARYSVGFVVPDNANIETLPIFEV